MHRRCRSLRQDCRRAPRSCPPLMPTSQGNVSRRGRDRAAADDGVEAHARCSSIVFPSSSRVQLSRRGGFSHRFLSSSSVSRPASRPRDLRPFGRPAFLSLELSPGLCHDPAWATPSRTSRTSTKNSTACRRVSPDGVARVMRKVRSPAVAPYRIPVGIALTAGGVVGFLPILGFWMVPLGLAVLAARRAGDAAAAGAAPGEDQRASGRR